MRSEIVRFATAARQRRWWVRFIVLTAIFLAWTGIGTGELFFAVVAGALASTISFQSPDFAAVRFRPGAFLVFVPYFLSISIRGGIDVAKRAFSPSMPIEPGFVRYLLRVSEEGPAAVFFVSTISLVPGTLFVDLEEKTVLVHVLDVGSGDLEKLEKLERRVAPIFGESVSEDKSGER